jgi:hypothetical protein
MCQQTATIVTGDVWPQKVETRTSSFQLKPDSFRRYQDPIRLNLMHERSATVGQLVALEHDATGLWATFTSDELALLHGAATPWYLSAEAVWQGGDVHATDIQLRGAALVRNPASTCIRPALVLAGRLDRKPDRQRWRLERPERERIERAAEALQRRRSGDPVDVIDNSPERQTERRRLERMNDSYLPLEHHHSGRGRGPVRWSAPNPNSIIAVR